MKYLLAAILLKLMELSLPEDPDSVYRRCTHDVQHEKVFALKSARAKTTRKRVKSDAWYGLQACEAERQILIQKAIRYL